MALALTTLGQKIYDALAQSLGSTGIRIEDEERITKIVISPDFARMPSLERQQAIDSAIDSAKEHSTPEERLRIGMFFASKPSDFRKSDLRVRVTEIREVDAEIEVFIAGSRSVADYVRSLCSGLEGVSTDEPRPNSGTRGRVWGFRARGNEAEALTKERVTQWFKDVPFLKVSRNL